MQKPFDKSVVFIKKLSLIPGIKAISQNTIEIQFKTNDAISLLV